MAKIKIIGNTTATPVAIPDWNQTNSTAVDYIKNKPDLITRDNVEDVVSELTTELQDSVDNLESEIDAKITAPALATEGYVLTVKSVDNGSPVEWEATELPKLYVADDEEGNVALGGIADDTEMMKVVEAYVNTYLEETLGGEY